MKPRVVNCSASKNLMAAAAAAAVADGDEDAYDDAGYQWIRGSSDVARLRAYDVRCPAPIYLRFVARILRLL